MATSTSSPGELETRKDAASPVSFWDRNIQLASKEEKGFRQDGRMVVDLYRADANNSSGVGRSRTRSYNAPSTDSAGVPKYGKRFNLLYSNTETLKPAIYAKLPKAEVGRRYRNAKENQPAAREVAEILERSLDYVIGEDDPDNDFDDVMNGVRDDGLLPGRGISRVKYEAEIVKRFPQVIPNDVLDPETGDVLVEGTPTYILDGQPVEPDGFEGEDERPFVEEKASESVFPEYVYWEDLRISPARRWKFVTWIAFRHIMSREQLVEAFGEKGRDIPLNYTQSGYEIGDGTNKDTPAPDSIFKRAEIWEVWDKKKRERVWVATGMPDIIEKEDDPLNLAGFFPIAQPFVLISTTDTLIPRAEYMIYQDQASEIDRLTTRIMALVEYLKVTGLYDAAQKETQSLLSAPEGELVGVEIGSDLRAKGGLEGAIWFMPIDKIAQVLVGLYNEREQAKQAIYEIIGISDIQRGASRASETAKAQGIKANFGSLRIAPRHKAFQNYLRNTLKICAEIIAERFDRRTLEQMTGLEVSDPVLQMLRDEKIRGYKIDIETDSTSQPDAEVQKQQAIELTTATTQFLQAAGGVAADAPETVPLLMEMLKLTFKSFGMGRSFEDVLDKLAAQLEQKAAQPPPPNPEMELKQEEMKIKQGELRIKEAELQLKEQELRLKGVEVASDRDVDIKKIAAENARTAVTVLGGRIAQ